MAIRLGQHTVKLRLIKYSTVNLGEIPPTPSYPLLRFVHCRHIVLALARQSVALVAFVLRSTLGRARETRLQARED
jgi:hypothetical protein